jgi:hypothetical protein
LEDKDLMNKVRNSIVEFNKVDLNNFQENDAIKFMKFMKLADEIVGK